MLKNPSQIAPFLSLKVSAKVEENIVVIYCSILEGTKGKTLRILWYLFVSKTLDHEQKTTPSIVDWGYYFNTLGKYCLYSVPQSSAGVLGLTWPPFEEGT